MADKEKNMLNHGNVSKGLLHANIILGLSDIITSFHRMNKRTVFAFSIVFVRPKNGA